MGPGARALLILIPVALVGFAIDGVVLLEREDAYRAEAAKRAAARGAAAASNASSTPGTPGAPDAPDASAPIKADKP